MSTSGGDRGGGKGVPRGVSLPNTVHSEVAPYLPLPSLPVFCGAQDPEVRLFDGPASSSRAAAKADPSRIADLVASADVSYLNLRSEATPVPSCRSDPPNLYNEVIRCNSEAFECTEPGSNKKQFYQTPPVHEKSRFDKGRPLRDHGETHIQLPEDHVETETITPSKKSKVKKKGSKDHGPTAVDTIELQDDILQQLSDSLEDFCGKAEVPTDEQDDGELLALSFDNLKILVIEIVSPRAKKVLHLIPVDILARLLRVLDYQIHRAQGLSINGCDGSDSDAVTSIYVALESIHAALAIMTHNDMPKQLYKEEIIERILEFTKHQIGDVMSACDPTYRALHNPGENGYCDDDDDLDADLEFGSASKKRRISRGAKAKRSTSNRVSDAAFVILQKLCTILGLLKDLLTIERLSDSCILQLLKTSFTTLLVDNILLLQLKSISLISGVFISYSQHRTYVLDEVFQVLLKVPLSKRVPRTYHLPDEEQRIQMISALVIRLVHSSANLPDAFRQPSSANSVFDASIDPNYPIECNEAVTDTCCQFWSRVLSRLTSTKSQDLSELKTILENLVMDLLTTLYLPEYPASAPILEVLCVLLLQNAGLKCKDVAARSMAIDILGTIAARLKRDSAICQKESFWIVKELVNSNNVEKGADDECAICRDGRVDKPLFLCQGCQRFFHADCMGVGEPEVPSRGWFCLFCNTKKELTALHSHCESHCTDGVSKKVKSTKKSSDNADSISKMEVVQQMLLNHVHDDNSADDLHLFICWYYLCMWYKDDPKSEQKFHYYLARLKSKDIVRDSGMPSSILTQDSVKKIALAMGQYNSFSRGFNKILHMLLASLMENSPVIRAKALRAVSIIVEADPEVLCKKAVQTSVEGKFRDSAISVREAALELVGRHIVSHPDVGLKYFEKIAERIIDSGVSVRKRAIKIIREMCISNSNFPEFTRACTAIMSRVSDEESSVQDLVCKTFYEFWFEEPSSSEARVFANNSTVPLEVAKKTEQMVEMLRRMPNHQNLIVVIKRSLALDFLPQSTKAAGINPITIASVRKRCELMCKFLLERILQVEEMTNEEVEVRAVPYVLLLHAFCVLDPTLCAPSSNPSQFVVTLQPYLKTQADSRVVAQLLESIIFIIASVLPLLRKLPPNVVEELEQDLKQMIVRHSFLSVVHACIKCLCSLSKLTGKGSAAIEYLVQLFFKRLDSLGFDNQQQVARSLFCLGLLIRYGNPLMTTSYFSDTSIDVKKSLSVFRKYLNGENFVLKTRSLQALGHVLIARPEFMLEKDVGKILEATLASGTDMRLKMQSLQNIFEYLLDAESQMATEESKVAEATHSVVNGTVPVAAGAGDTNICGGIIQLYWENILGRCLDANEQVRQSAIKIVEVVLRQGLVHPITCVPHLIALETDPEEANSKLAHHLLSNMNEKYPSFFESRLGDGLQKSFIFIRTLTESAQNSNPKQQSKAADKGRFENSSFNHARLGVSRIYKLIRANRASRNKFMSSVVRKFDNPRWHDQVVPFLMYCSEILALLPFTLPDEPLYLIYTINRVIQVRAGPIESNLKSFLHPSQEVSKTVINGNGVVQQDLSSHPLFNDSAKMDLNGSSQEVPGSDPAKMDLNGASQEVPGSDPAAAISHESNCNACNSNEAPELDLQKIQGDCLAAIALKILLKLKRHMKIIYSLNDARCQEYSPTEPLKPGEVLSKQSVPFNLGELSTEMPTTQQEVLQIYQEFKSALKEDTVDYSAYTSNIKKRKPPPPKRERVVRPKQTTVRYNEEDEDDDDDDETWGSGRKLSSSSARRSSSRLRQ